MKLSTFAKGLCCAILHGGDALADEASLVAGVFQLCRTDKPRHVYIFLSALRLFVKRQDTYLQPVDIQSAQKLRLRAVREARMRNTAGDERIGERGT